MNLLLNQWVPRLLIVFMALSSVGAPVQTGTAGTTSVYPNHPIVLVAPFPPGHTTDIENRKIAPLLAKALGQPVTVENWPGEGGTVALEKMAHVAPDGYTVIMHGINGLAIAPHVMKVRYDPIADFTPIVLEGSTPLILVANPELPVNSVQDLIAYGKSNPGKLNAGSFGVATNVHLALALFNRLTGLEIPHTVYPGGMQTMADLMAGKFQLMFDFPLAVEPYVKSGRLKALAVTSNRRSVRLPNVPTFAEAGIAGMDVIGWQGLLAPAGTPPEIVAKLNTEILKIFKAPENRELFKVSQEVAGTPEEFAALIKAEYARWGKFIKEAGIRLE